MDVRELALSIASFACLAPLQALADESPARSAADVFLCADCTASQYIDGARSLGAGRHVLFDFSAARPRAFVVMASKSPESAAVASVPTTDQEERRFAVAKSVWAGPEPGRASEADLEDWMWRRNAPRTAADVAVTGAYQNDISEALMAVLPALLSRDVPYSVGAICRPCKENPVKNVPENRAISVALSAGGSVDFNTGEYGLLRVRAVHDASGKTWSFDENGIAR